MKSRSLEGISSKEIMKTRTQKDTILDLVLTNLHNHNNKLLTFPPFALSDHNNISVWPQMRKVGTAPDQLNFKRDLQPSQKAETGRYLCSFDWPLLLSSFKPAVSYSVFLNKLYTQALTFWCWFSWTHMFLGWWSTWKI